MSQTLHACREELSGSGDDARATASGIAVGGSLLLHFGIFGLVFLMRPDAAIPEPPDPEVSIVVSMVSYNPQLRWPQPESVDSEPENLEETTPEPQLEEIEPSEETGPAAQSAGIDQTPATPPTAPASELPGDTTIENAGLPGVSSAAINNSVTAYVANYKRSLTSDWLSACLQYQNEHGVKTCPQGEDGKSETTRVVNETTSRLFSTYVGGTAANARASRQLLAEMDAARPFLNENSVMGELARQRYELAQSNYCRLNVCRSFALTTSAMPIVTALSFNTVVSNEGRIKLAGFGNEGGGPGMLTGLMSFIPGPKPAQPVAPYIPYRFTAPPAQQAESETEFKVIAPVFPVRR